MTLSFPRPLTFPLSDDMYLTSVHGKQQGCSLE